MDALTYSLIGVVVALAGLIAGAFDAWLSSLVGDGLKVMTRIAEYLGFALAFGGLWYASVDDMGSKHGTVAVWLTAVIVLGVSCVVLPLGALAIRRFRNP